MEEAGLKVCKQRVVTASIGSAFHPGDGSTAEELLAEADRRMYESKERYYKLAGESARPWHVDSVPLYLQNPAATGESVR